MSGRKALERLLILAARFELSPEEHSEMRGILREGLDWPRLLGEGRRLGIVPLLHLHLSKGEERPQVPPDILAALENGHRTQSIQNLRIYGTLLKILRAFRERGIPVILLKGAFLSTRLYPDMALRPMSDIDLLCRPEDVLRAQDLVISLGFRAPFPPRYPNAIHERVEARTHHHLPRITSGVIDVEVHSRIFEEVPFGTFSPESIWQESRQCTVGETTFRCLCTEHQLLHLCTHLYKHMNAGKAALYWFCDIHEFLRKHRHAIDWIRLHDTAQRLGMADQIGAVLHIMKHHWKSPVSEAANVPAIRTRFEILRQKVRISYFSRCLAGVKHIESRWDRFVFLWGFFFPSSEFMSTRYIIRNKAMLVLYYVYRPFSLTARATGSLFRALRKHP